MNVLYALLISIAFTLLALALLAGLLISSTLWLGQLLNAPPRKHAAPRAPHRAKFSYLAPLTGFFHNSLASARALLHVGDNTQIPAPETPTADTAQDTLEVDSSSKDTAVEKEISATQKAVPDEPPMADAEADTAPETLEDAAKSKDIVQDEETSATREAAPDEPPMIDAAENLAGQAPDSPPPAGEPTPALPKPAFGEAAVATLKIKRVTLGTGAYLRRREKLRKAADKADNPPALKEARFTVQALPVRHRSILFARGLSDLSQVHPYSRCRAPSLPGLTPKDPAAL